MPDAAVTGPVPIVVAVTGHRDLRPSDIPGLTARISEIFQDLRAAYPHSDLELLSPLAEGADRLVAHVALDLGVRLIVPLPIAIDDYVKDFADAASIAEFHALRGRAARTFVVPAPDETARARPECYTCVGAYLVARCHLLLALWNGLPSDKAGGTAEIVQFRRQGTPARYGGTSRLLDPPDTGVVHHIVTPRQSDPATVGAPLTVQLLPPEAADDTSGADAAQRRICQYTDAFNRLSARTGAGTTARRRQSEAWLVGSFERAARAPGLRELIAAYTCADELAAQFQRRTLSTLRNLFLIVCAAVLAFEIFADEVFQSSPLPIILYAGLLAGAYGLYRLAARRGYETKYLDYRALAEGLRVQFYWRLAGVPAAAAHHLRSRLEDAEWIALALQHHDGTHDAEADPARDPAEEMATLRRVVTEWVEGQQAFFVKASRRDALRLDALDRWMTVCAWASLVLTASAVVVSVWLHGVRLQNLIEGNLHTFDAMAAIIGLSSAAAAFVGEYADKRALDEHITRYDRAAALLGRARYALVEPLARGDAEDVRRLLHELGIEALEENAQWVTLHRERPLEVPT